MKVRYESVIKASKDSKPKVSIPIGDIANITAGFYIGYMEGKGVDVKPSIEYLTKYGPTALAITASPLLLKAGDVLKRICLRGIQENLKTGNITIEKMDGIHDKKLYELGPDQREKGEAKVRGAINNLEERINNPPSYTKSTLKAGAWAAAETLVGYAAGRAYSQFN